VIDAVVEQRATRILMAAIVLVLIAGLIGFWFTTPEPVRVPVMQVPDLPDEDLGPLVARGGVEDVASRPLFWESRRPVAFDEAVASPEPVPSPAGIRLLGVLIAPNQSAVLITDGEQVRKVARGESFAGWVVDEIGPTGAVLMSGRERVELPVVVPPSPTIRFDH